MAIGAFIFGILIFSFSVFVLLGYLRSSKALESSRRSLARQRELDLKVLADLQARMEADERRFEEKRRALLERAGGASGGRDVEHAA
jgi:hypothetical protein